MTNPKAIIENIQATAGIPIELVGVTPKNSEMYYVTYRCIIAGGQGNLETTVMSKAIVELSAPTPPRSQLLEQLAAAETNLAIAAHLEQEKNSEYDFIVQLIESGDIAPNTDLTPFVWRMENAKAERIQKWHIVDGLKAQLLTQAERAEIRAALNEVKANERTRLNTECACCGQVQKSYVAGYMRGGISKTFRFQKASNGRVYCPECYDFVFGD
jgi:hypothetical protein